MKSSKYSISTPRQSLKDENSFGLQSFTYSGSDQHTNGVTGSGYYLKRESHGNAPNGKSYQNGNKTKDGLVYDDEYYRQGEYGIGCFRPKPLQCLAKSLWTFICFYCPCAVWIVSVHIYLQSQVISLERYFQINSSQIGLLMSADNIGSLVIVLFGSHFGKFHHIPRILSASAFGIGVIVMALAVIQAVSPVHLPVSVSSSIPMGGLPKNQTLSMPQMLLMARYSGLLCMNQPTGMGGTNFIPSESFGAEQDDTVKIPWGYYYMFVVLFIAGALGSYRIPLQTYYVERNVRDRSHSGIFVGLLATAMLFGAPVSMFLGGAMNEKAVDLKDSDMWVYDPRWIGCWWLGFLIIGACIIVTSLPGFLLPRHIIHDESKDPSLFCCFVKQKAADTKQQLSSNAKDKHLSNGIEARDTVATGARLKPEGDQPSKIAALDELKDLPKSVKRVLGNPVVVLLLIEFVVLMTGFNGIVAFQLKYIDNQFDFSPVSVSYYLGFGQLAATVVGSMLGGILITRLKLTRAGMFKLTLIGQVIQLCCSVSLFFIGCENHSIVGLNKPSRNMTSLPCDCTTKDALFVCGNDGIDYMSPCLAGCQHTNGLTFSNCLMISGAGLAQPGFCNRNCSMFTPFILMYMLTLLAGAVTVAPRMLMLARTVKPKDIALVVGLNAFVATLGAILGPIIFGHIYDTACILWHKSGAYCLLSDKEDLRFTFLGSELAFRGTAFIFFIIATLIVIGQQRQETANEINKVENEIDMEMTVPKPKRLVNDETARDNGSDRDDDENGDDGNESDPSRGSCGSGQTYTKPWVNSDECKAETCTEGDN